MTEQVTVKTNVKRLSDPDAIAFAGTVIKGVYVDKGIAAAPPFDEATLQTAVDDLKGAIAAQAQAGGGTVVTAFKKKRVPYGNTPIDFRGSAGFVSGQIPEPQIPSGSRGSRPSTQ